MKMNSKTRGFAYLLAIFLVISCGFWRLLRSQDERMQKARESYKEGSAVNMDDGLASADLANILQGEDAYPSRGEARFVADHITSRLKDAGSIPYLNVLARHYPALARRNPAYDFRILLDSAGSARISGYPVLKARLEATEAALGILRDSTRTVLPPDSLGACPEGWKACRISVSIKEKAKRFQPAKNVDEDVTICVRRHWRSRSPGRNGKGKWALEDSVYTYVRASHGVAEFCLPVEDPDGNASYYSIIPVQEGYRFGDPKPTFKTGLFRSRVQDMKMTFTRNRAYLMPLSPAMLHQIKESGSVTVRTPDQYRKRLLLCLLAYCIAWMLVYLLCLAKDAREGRSAEYGLVVAAAAVTGLGLLTLASLPAHPLQDSLAVVPQTFKGLLPGLLLLCAASCIDWVKAFQSIQLRYGMYTRLQGLPLAAAAVVLAMALAALGSGPGGAKVNLWGFQPQHIIKYIFVLFGAVYLANRPYIAAFAPHADIYSQKRHWKVVAKAVMFLLIMLFFQVVILHDMGSGIVLGLTMVVMYACARQDVPEMLVGALSFAALAALCHLTVGDSWGIVAFLAWTILWVGGGLRLKNKVYTSAILVNIVITAMVFGGSIASELPVSQETAEKLSTRAEIWHSPFDNLTGSDQLARSLWDFAEGGVLGRAGLSAAASVPQANNDFIYSSLVATSGLAGGAFLLMMLFFLCVFGCRTAWRQEDPFGYYLATGINVAILGQSLFILAGVTGLCPLSGVTLFGMSDGCSSLWMDLIALGALVSLSRENGKASPVNRKAARILTLFAFGCLIFILLATAWHGVIKRERTLSTPAVTQKADGSIAVSYPPAIQAFMGNLKKGCVYDRKGRLLIGSDEDGRRTYPQKDAVFFWTGNLYERTLFSRTGLHPAGVLAEPRWHSFMRGFDNHPKVVFKDTDRLRSPYLPGGRFPRTMPAVLYDYSEVIPLWLDKKKFEEFNSAAPERDITVTLDSHLQTAIQDSFKRFAVSRGLGPLVRISLVLIDAATGDVIASACHPTIDHERIRSAVEEGIRVYRDDLDPDFTAYTDMDLGLCHHTAPGSVFKLFVAVAGFNKLGAAMEHHTERIAAEEKIYSHDRTGLISLADAIIGSNNPFFVKVLNSEDLYSELGALCWQCGVTVNGFLPYCLQPDEVASDHDDFDSMIQAMRDTGIERYDRYMAAAQPRKINDYEWAIAFGQGPVSASPLSVARLIGAIANDGVLMKTRLRADVPTAVQARVLAPENAMKLRSAMRGQATLKGKFQSQSSTMGGKTGTPERSFALSPSHKSNDAWYGFYLMGEETTSGHPLAAVVRFERVGEKTSSLAMDYVREKFLHILRNEGYLRRL